MGKGAGGGGDIIDSVLKPYSGPNAKGVVHVRPFAGLIKPAVAIDKCIVVFIESDRSDPPNVIAVYFGTYIIGCFPKKILHFGNT